MTITEYPYAPLAANLAHNGGSMMSAELIQADYDAVDVLVSPSLIQESVLEWLHQGQSLVHQQLVAADYRLKP